MQESDRQAQDSWAEAESIMQVTTKKDEILKELDDKCHPKRTMIHKFFVFISFLVSLGAVAMLIGQILGLAFQSNGVVEYILRIYTMVLCVVTVLVEWQIKTFGKESKILHLWLTRGLFYAFIGVLGLDQIDTSDDSDTASTWFDPVHHYFWIVAWIMIVCGCLYFVMGIFCLQLLYDKLQREYEDRLQRAPEVRRTVNLASNTV